MIGFPIPKEILEAKGQPRNYWGARARLTGGFTKTFRIIEEEYDPPLEKFPMLKYWIDTVGLVWLNNHAERLGELEMNRREDGNGMFMLMVVRHDECLEIGAWRYDLPDLLIYELDTIPDRAKWGGPGLPPIIGDLITLTKYGSGRVLDYFVEQNVQLGLRMLLDDQTIQRHPESPWVFSKGKDLQLPEKSKEMNTGEEQLLCGFCGLPGSECGPLVMGGPKDNKLYICGDCCIRGTNHLAEKRKAFRAEEANRIEIPHPRSLYDHMSKFVVGQERAKRTLAVSIANHYTRVHDLKMRQSGGMGAWVEADIANVALEKSNVLMIGPTGSGKTLLAKSLAKFLGVPFVIGDATTLTEAGYVGEDVENLLLKLIIEADWDISKAEHGIIFIDEIDKLHKTTHNVSIMRDVSGEGVQQALLKMMEGYICNVSPQGGRKHPEQQFIQVDTSNILFICGGTFDGLERIIAQRLGENHKRIGFRADLYGDDGVRSRNDLLMQVEQVDLERFGLIPELIGRLPILAPLGELSLDDLINVLQKPQDALLKQFCKLFAYVGVNLSFSDEAIREIAIRASLKGMGARALRSVVEDFMVDLKFNLPPDFKGEILITPEVIRGEKQPKKNPPLRMSRIRRISPP